MSNNEEKSQRGSVDNPAEPRFLVVGQVTKPHGVRGEVRVNIFTEIPERLTWLETIYIGETNPTEVGVEAVRFHKGFALLKLVGYHTRESAETLRGEFLCVTEAEAIPLEDGEYYLYQLEGLQVVTDEGKELGKVVDVIETNANNVFVVRGQLGEVLLPDIDDVVQDIDFENGCMQVHLLPGLLP